MRSEGRRKLALSIQWSGAVAALLLVNGCSTKSEEAPSGRLAMRLGTETNGNTYRLRQALFDVAGPQNVLITSEDDLATGSATLALAVGDYQVELVDGWFIERQLAGASVFETVAADLTSDNPTAFSIVDDEVTAVAYAFDVEGIPVVFAEGTLDLRIQVTEREVAGVPTFSPPDTCDFEDRTGCEQLACALTCPFCPVSRCENLIDCIADNPTCPTPDDPLCGTDPAGADVCTLEFQQAGNGNPQDGAFVAASELIECLCTSPRL